jgi:hypothetical protein
MSERANSCVSCNCLLGETVKSNNSLGGDKVVEVVVVVVFVLPPVAGLDGDAPAAKADNDNEDPQDDTDAVEANDDDGDTEDEEDDDDVAGDDEDDGDTEKDEAEGSDKEEEQVADVLLGTSTSSQVRRLRMGVANPLAITRGRLRVWRRWLSGVRRLLGTTTFVLGLERKSCEKMASDADGVEVVEVGVEEALPWPLGTVAGTSLAFPSSRAIAVMLTGGAEEEILVLLQELKSSILAVAVLVLVLVRLLLGGVSNMFGTGRERLRMVRCVVLFRRGGSLLLLVTRLLGFSTPSLF